MDCVNAARAANGPRSCADNALNATNTVLALSVIAHPSPTSFSHAMAATAADVLHDLGCLVRSHDLYAEGFQPVQPVGEALNTRSDDALVELRCTELRQTDLILVVYPNWWSQKPAILKGRIDRVGQGRRCAYTVIPPDTSITAPLT